MNDILVAKFPKLPRPFTIRRLPWLCRFYMFAFWSGGGLLRKALRKLFPLARSFGGGSGEFEFAAAGKKSLIRFNPRNLEFHSLYNDRLCANGYETDVAAVLEMLLPENGVFYDIGSNWGYHSLLAAGSRPRLQVHAFEPTPGTFQDLTSCVQQAGLESSVQCHNFALSDSDGSAFIRMPDHLHSGCAEVSASGGDAAIKLRRLDGLDLPKPDVIKMDVEGHEIEVLKGATAMLQSKRPYLIFENKLDYADVRKVLEIFDFLATQGYRCFAPVTNHDPGGKNVLLPCGWLPPADSDGLALIPFTAQTRLLRQPEFNVFACHEGRLAELQKTFQVWKP